MSVCATSTENSAEHRAGLVGEPCDAHGDEVRSVEGLAANALVEL